MCGPWCFSWQDTQIATPFFTSYRLSGLSAHRSMWWACTFLTSPHRMHVPLSRRRTALLHSRYCSVSRSSSRCVRCFAFGFAVHRGSMTCLIDPSGFLMMMSPAPAALRFLRLLVSGFHNRFRHRVIENSPYILCNVPTLNLWIKANLSPRYLWQIIYFALIVASIPLRAFRAGDHVTPYLLAIDSLSSFLFRTPNSRPREIQSNLNIRPS